MNKDEYVEKITNIVNTNGGHISIPSVLYYGGDPFIVNSITKGNINYRFMNKNSDCLLKDFYNNELLHMIWEKLEQNKFI